MHEEDYDLRADLIKGKSIDTIRKDDEPTARGALIAVGLFSIL